MWLCEYCETANDINNSSCIVCNTIKNSKWPILNNIKRKKANMMYVSAIAVDFGSTNSGCARIMSRDENGNLRYTTPEFLHSNGIYPKDNSWIFIEPAFLERIKHSYKNLEDKDFRIESRIIQNENPNIIWTRKSIQENSSLISEGKWIGFSRFKMLLYHGVDNYDETSNFPIILIIKTFLRVLKIECIHLESIRLGRMVLSDEIQWGITIPSIWTEANKSVMVEIACEIFSTSTRILSEPEGPLVSNLLHSSNNGLVTFENNRTSLVIDLGGGTTDICLMKEVLQDDGTYKMEMITDSDGSAAGGNDIDEAFLIYMLRHISKGKKSNNGLVYDELDNSTLKNLIFNGFAQKLDDRIAFEDNWNKLKSEKEDKSGFEFTIGYRKWLIDNGHSSIANLLKEFLIDGCEFEFESFIQQVFNPTFNRICDKVIDIINRNKRNINFDKIILSGGMSCNYRLEARLKRAILDVLGGNANEKFCKVSNLYAGGAVLDGSCYMLINRSFIKRLARKNYYYDALTDSSSLMYQIKSIYNDFGLNLRIGSLSQLMEEQHEYLIGDINSIVLAYPVALKGQFARNYETFLCSGKGQTEVSIKFFSSNGEFILFPSENNKNLILEGEIFADVPSESRFKLEVDFNEAQISNALHYILKNDDTGEILNEDYIHNVISVN